MTQPSGDPNTFGLSSPAPVWQAPAASQPGQAPALGAPAWPTAPAWQATPPAAYPAPPGAPAWQAPAPGYPAMAPPLTAADLDARTVVRSPILGIIGLVLVVVCGVVYFLNSLTLYREIFAIVGPSTATGPGAIASLTPDQLSQLEASAAGPLTGVVAASVGGLVGWIVSIVATARNSGRAAGIIGIVLGSLAPLVLLIVAASIALTSA